MINYAEAKARGLNPRYRKIKKCVGLGGIYPFFQVGQWVLVTDACNQPNWKKRRLVFIDRPGAGCELLTSLNEGIINP